MSRTSTRRLSARLGLHSSSPHLQARNRGVSERRVRGLAADEPRAVPRVDQKKELAKKALEQAFQGKENLFPKLDDQGNDGNGNGSGDRGGGGGGGGGNNGEDWGEVFNMAVRIVLYVFLGIVFLIIWPKFFTGATGMYNKFTNKEIVEAAPTKEDFDEEDFDEFERQAVGQTAVAKTSSKQASVDQEASKSSKPVKRAFPEREAFDTWQFGASKGMDLQDELTEKQITQDTLNDEMTDPTGKFHDEFQAKPRSKHIVLKDTKSMDKSGPYQDYVTSKWK